jgi:subtilisin family serine protease
MKRLLSFVLAMILVSSLVSPMNVKGQGNNSKEPKIANVKKGTNHVSDIIQIPKSTVTRKADEKKVKSNVVTKKEYGKNEVIVKFKQNMKTQEASTIEKGLGLEKAKNLGPSGMKLYKIKKGSTVEGTVAKLKQFKNVEFAEPNYKLQINAVKDPYYNYLWGLKNVGQYVNGYYGTAGIDINVESAWSKTTGANVIVGVIDSGIDINHPDLKNNIWVNKNEIPNDGIDNDNNGYIDDVNGWDFYHDDKTVYDSYDGEEHGTHVAGTIGASANTQGVIGVAPNVKIMSLKFIGPDGTGWTSDAVEAIYYAKKMGAHILNNSWGGSGYSQSLYDAIQSYGGLFVAAAGNDYQTNNDYYPYYPSSYDLPNILSVAAIDSYGYLAYFSNYGPKSVDIAAPGQNILSTAPNNKYQYMNGTSMATPHVTGAAALYLSKNPKASATDVKESLMTHVKKLSSLSGLMVSGGLVDTGASLSYNPDDDIPGVAFTGTKVSEKLDQNEDLDDVYAVNLIKGEKLVANLTGASGTDFDLYLYDSNATTVKSSEGILTYSEKSGTSTESITFIAPYDGTFYLDAYAYKGKGTYSLSVTLGATKGTYDNKNTVLNYQSSTQWKVVSHSKASSGSYSSVNASNSSVELVFNGTGIQYNALKNDQQGIARVTVDGTSYEVDLYSTIPQYNAAAFELANLKPGVHTLKIEWTGSRNKSARKAATSINIDSIIVLGTQASTIEQNHASVSYTGSWSTTNSSSYSGGSAKYTVSKGSAAEISFNGESIKLVGYKGKNNGKANIYLDGKLVKTVDYYSSSTQTKVTIYEATNLSKGFHTLKITNRGDKNSASTGTNINVDSFVINQNYSSYLADEKDSRIKYSGSWGSKSSANFIGGTSKYTATKGNSLTLPFVGKGIKVFSYTSNNHGKADIYIDGKLISTVDLYSKSTGYQVPIFSKSNLSQGAHTIKIVNKGSKSTSSGTYINIDAFEVTAQ